MILQDTIVALASPAGVGALGVIRLSGKNVFEIVQKTCTVKNLAATRSHTVHYGYITDGERIVDEILLSVFRAPKSFTTEDSIEISCHGSPYIAQEIINLLIKHGARLAKPGEFTMRAFLNGRIDLSQAEAVADLISSSSKASHEIALKQMRGGISNILLSLREQLVNFASYIELELDFAEEDVEFANRKELITLIHRIQQVVTELIQSFTLGNAIKNGIPIAIAGKPNAGKSTLLNTLLNEERAIVSDIAGTTRDTIEEIINIDGIEYRLIDTAGLRQTEDVIEKIGVQKSYEKIQQAQLLIYLTDGSELHDAQALTEELNNATSFNIPYLLVVNKSDVISENIKEQLAQVENVLLISAKNKEGISDLKHLIKQITLKSSPSDMGSMITNVRHHDALKNVAQSLQRTLEAIDRNITTELLSFELKQALNHLGEITGEVTNDEILGNIFSKFCIGK